MNIIIRERQRDYESHTHTHTHTHILWEQEYPANVIFHRAGRSSVPEIPARCISSHDFILLEDTLARDGCSENILVRIVLHGNARMRFPLSLFLSLSLSLFLSPFLLSTVGGQVLNLRAYPCEYFNGGCASPTWRHKSFLRHRDGAIGAPLLRSRRAREKKCTAPSPYLKHRERCVENGRRNRKVTSGKTRPRLGCTVHSLTRISRRRETQHASVAWIYTNVESKTLIRIGRAIANAARYAVDHIWLSLLRGIPI
jgi:hypothetical protein